MRQVRARQRGTCAICPSTYRFTVHHKVNREEGGPDTLDNLVGLCGKHHTQYEADRRAGKPTQLRRLVEAL